MASSNPAHQDPAYKALRNGRPAAVAAVLEDGDTRELKVREGKGKWDKVLATARALGAVGLELRDEDGAIQEVVPLDGHERVEDEPEARAMAPATDLERTLKLCADFADRATGRQQELLSSVCETAIQVMRASADRAERSERALDKVLRAHEKVLMSGRHAVEGDAINNTDMLAMMAAMLGGGGDASAMMKQLGGGAKPGNGHDAEEDMVPVPRSVFEKAKRILAAHPDVIDTE